MKKKSVYICCCALVLISLFQVYCIAGENRELELVGSQWRLIKNDPNFGHSEFLLYFSEAGKMSFANLPLHDEWEINDKKVILKLNRDPNIHKYIGKLIDRDQMSGTTISQSGVEVEWKAYRHKRKCFDTISFKSNLTLEICIEAQVVDEQNAVEPYLSPWKTKDRLIHYSAGYSSSSVYGSNWLKEQKGKVFKAILSIKNKTTTTQRLPIPLLSDIIIHSKDEGKQAVALCYPKNQLVVEMKGSAMETDILPNESVELLYYIPTFTGKATLEVKGLGSSKILLK